MISNHKYRTIASKAILLIAFILCATACSNDDSNAPSQPNEVFWKISSTVSFAEGSSAIIITGATGTEWSAKITEGSTWCSFSSTDYVNGAAKIGTVKDGLNVLYVYYKANAGNQERQAKIAFQFTGEAEQVFDLTQLAQNQENLPSFTVWPELPASKVNVNYQYATHYTPLNNRSVRNYSICFDKTKKAALWVAYPIHNAYLGGVNRTDAWAFDPIIPFIYQPNCIERSYKGNYDRGHQLPSADRLATKEMNAQTFYMTNMTPQLDRLNQDMWAKLESKVRANRCSDTLYVVTGAYFGSGATTTADGAGNVVPIPTNYFKVLLRTKSGTTGKQIKDCNESELISMGVWVEQKSYGNIEPPRSICTSVADIEAKTGFTFFPQVPTAVKQQNNPTAWGIN